VDAQQKGDQQADKLIRSEEEEDHEHHEASATITNTMIVVIVVSRRISVGQVTLAEPPHGWEFRLTGFSG
jgi:hypothetical protein